MKLKLGYYDYKWIMWELAVKLSLKVKTLIDTDRR